METENRLLNRPLMLAFLASFGSLTSFFLLLGAGPMKAGAAGGTAAAGMVTAVLLFGTVFAELVATALLRRLGARWVIVAGALLLGLPALAMAGPVSPAVTIAVSFARGIGFGLCGVVTGALVASLLPPDRRGEGLGLLGIVDGVPAVVALPAGVWVAAHYGYAVLVLAVGAVALLPLVLLTQSGGNEAMDNATGAGLRSGLRQSVNLRLSLVFAAATATAGVVDSFLPLATGVTAGLAALGLLVQALAGTSARWWAGRYGDRHGHARLLVPAVSLTVLGMIAMIWMGHPVVLLGGMVIFGVGFGIIENTIFVLLIEAMPPAGAGLASALWNLAYDAGYGAGPAVFGLFAARIGYPVAFAMSGMVILAVLPVALSLTGRSTRNARHALAHGTAPLAACDSRGPGG